MKVLFFNVFLYRAIRVALWFGSEMEFGHKWALFLGAKDAPDQILTVSTPVLQLLSIGFLK